MTIKEARVRAGLTQKELADRLGVGRTTVTNWETGTGMPRTARLGRLAAVLECSIDDLLKTDDDAPS